MLEKILRRIYSVIFYFAIPVILLRLYWRSRAAPEYRHRILERFGYFKFPNKKKGIWIHAVSLGEVNAAYPLIKSFQLRYPDLAITITTTTITGSKQVKSLFGDSIFHVYLPYDIPHFIRRFLRKVQPQLIIIIETELWPNLLWVSHQQKISLLLLNARISERSARNYSKIQPLTRAMLNYFSIISVQTAIEKQRYISLGVPNEKIIVTGSMKFDMSLPDHFEDTVRSLKKQIGERPAFIGGSTHENEEMVLLEAYKRIQIHFPQLILILVPRHPERFQAIYELCANHGFNVTKRSQNIPCNAETQVFLGDSVGELISYYAVADVVFVGGSLVPIGGHNVLEPAVLKKPILTGPYMHNFMEISKIMFEMQGLIQVTNAETIASTVISILNDPDKAKTLGKNAYYVVEKNRGSLEKNMEIINSHLEELS
jgi:3-deoxy-D-manno-octulosonic-acid transferase